MYKVILAIVSLGFLASRGEAQLYNEWIMSVDNLGESVTFPCYIVNVHPVYNISSNFSIVSWMLPDFQRLQPGSSTNNTNVSSDGWSLTLNNVAKADLGIYHCMLQNTTGAWSLVKWGLNMRGPYFVNLLEKYTKNLIIGFSAFGGFILLALAIITVYHFRWQPPVNPEITVEEYPVKLEHLMAGGANGHSNGGYTSQVNDDLKAQEVAAVAALHAATAGEPDLPGMVTQAGYVMNEALPMGYTNVAATKDDGSKVVNTAF